MLAKYIANYRRRKVIKRWRGDLKIQQKQSLFDTLYAQSDGFALSKRARIHHDNISLTYGEVLFEPFAAALSLAAPHEGDIYYDLGSGTGKACVVAALCFNISQCHGVEMLDALFDEAMRVRQLAPESLERQLYYHRDDFLNHNLHAASLVSLNAAAYFGELWQAIGLKLSEELQSGARVLVFSKRLPEPYFEQVHVSRIAMSWGETSLTLYKKK